jgi:hypothetical protein
MRNEYVRVYINYAEVRDLMRIVLPLINDLMILNHHKLRNLIEIIFHL